MPLSEHEQRLLDQIERALYQEDPKFASTVRSTDLRTHMRRRLRRAGIVFALGFVVMFAGVPTDMLALGVVGFVIMLVALLIAMTAWKRLGAGPGAAGQPDLHLVTETGQPRERPRKGKAGRAGKPAKAGRAGKTPRAERPKTTGSPLHRLEERWKRRWDERNR